MSVTVLLALWIGYLGYRMATTRSHSPASPCWNGPIGNGTIHYQFWQWFFWSENEFHMG